MSLTPPASIGVGLAVAGVVLAIHANATPTQADMQGLPSGNKDVDATERRATWMSIGIVSGISLLAADPTVFVIGSAMTIALAFATRHAVWTEATGGLLAQGPGQSVPGVAANVAPEITETQAYTMFSAAPSEFVSS